MEHSTSPSTGSVQRAKRRGAAPGLVTHLAHGADASFSVAAVGGRCREVHSAMLPRAGGHTVSGPSRRGDSVCGLRRWSAPAGAGRGRPLFDWTSCGHRARLAPLARLSYWQDALMVLAFLPRARVDVLPWRPIGGLRPGRSTHPHVVPEFRGQLAGFVADGGRVHLCLRDRGLATTVAGAYRARCDCWASHRRVRAAPGRRDGALRPAGRGRSGRPADRGRRRRGGDYRTVRRRHPPGSAVYVSTRLAPPARGSARPGRRALRRRPGRRPCGPPTSRVWFFINRPDARCR